MIGRPPQPASKWPVGTSPMHAAVRAHDWAATPLGPIGGWPQCLKTAVEMVLGMGFPAVLLWGRDLLNIHNEAYRQLIQGTDLPLGRNFYQSWPEVIEFTAPHVERAWRGETVILNKVCYPDHRPGAIDDICVTLSAWPVRDEADEIAGVCINPIEITERIRAEATLREREAQLSTILELLPIGVGLYDAEGKVLNANPAIRRVFDEYGPDLRIGSVRKPMFHSDGREFSFDEYPSVRALRGEVISETDLYTDIAGKKRWFKVDAVPLLREGKIVGGISVAHDVTETRENSDRMKALVAELQHRTRNLIAMVRALANTTLDRSSSVDSFRVKYCARLEALARVQGLLSQLTNGVTFEALLRAELTAHAAFDHSGVTLDGPADVPLRSGSVQTLALAIHELATNAIKYGALSQPHCRLAICWQVEAVGDTNQRLLQVEWRETGIVMDPDAANRRGLGRELIEQVLPYQHGAKTSYELGRDGVTCTIRLKISDGAKG